MKHNVATRGMQAAMIALVAGVLVCSLGGCVMVRDNGSERERIAQLEREVDELRAQQDQADKNAAKDTAKDAANAKDSSKKDAGNKESSEATPGATTSDATVQDFSTRADDLIARSQAATVPTERSAKVDAFLALDAEFDALDFEMDAYEDKREADYRAGTLSWDDYHAIDRAIETIEHRLDTEQDTLEHRFGMDD